MYFEIEHGGRGVHNLLRRTKDASYYFLSILLQSSPVGKQSEKTRKLAPDKGGRICHNTATVTSFNT